MIQRDRIAASVMAQNLHGILLTSPENVYYATGFSPHQLTVSRIPDFAYAYLDLSGESNDILITMDYEFPAFSDAEHLEIIAYDTWVGVKSVDEWRTGREESTGGTLYSALDRLKAFLSKESLDNKRIGFEAASLPVRYFTALQQALPGIKWVDISEEMIFARSVKTVQEIELYRRLCTSCDSALLKVAQIIQAGMSEKELIQVYREACIHSGFLPSSWSMLGSGPNSAVLQLATDKIIQNGECVRFDGGCEAGFQFYKTDFSRTWIIGDADPQLLRLKRVLTNAQRKMIHAVKPEMTFSELFRIGYNDVKKHIPNYRRGHLGHSISLGPQTADAPFISPSETRTMEPGMILCVEVPFYIREYNGFNIEDMILVTEDGCEILTHRTPHFLPNEERG